MENDSMTTELLAPRDVARLLDITTAGVIRLDERGKLVALRDASNRRFYDRETVIRFCRERQAQRQKRQAARHAR
jgi:DNA-binding transcriptional MerR regulator